MPRAMTPAMLAAIQATALYPAIFASIGFKTTTAYVWSGIGTITWGDNDWIGVGSLLGATSVEDAATIEARGITVTLSGLDKSLLSDAMGDFRLGKPAALYLGLFTGLGGTLIPDPIPVWTGRTDQPTVDVGADAATISINLENRLVEMNTPTDRRYTNEDTQMETPGDLFCMFVNSLQEMTLYWGQQANATNNI